MTDRCLIFGAGEHFLPPRFEKDDFIIAADAGYDYLLGLNVRPDIVVGDFDSSDTLAPPDIAVRLPVEKDDTDMAAAIRLALDRGFKSLHIYGGTGGRIDHTLANIQCLADIACRGAQGFLYGKGSVITALKDSRISFPPESRGIVSVFSHSDVSSGVYERGMKYPLNNAVLKNTRPLGVSNELKGDAADISVKSGTLIVVFPDSLTPCE